MNYQKHIFTTFIFDNTEKSTKKNLPKILKHDNCLRHIIYLSFHVASLKCCDFFNELYLQKYTRLIWKNSLLMPCLKTSIRMLWLAFLIDGGIANWSPSFWDYLSLFITTLSIFNIFPVSISLSIITYHARDLSTFIYVLYFLILDPQISIYKFRQNNE